MTAKADEASKTATEGLEKLKTVLTGVPAKVESVINTLCTPLPGADLQATCKTGAAEIVKSASSVLGQICTKGVAELIKLGKAACTKAAEAASGVVSQASGFCSSATSALPADTAKPLSEACIAVAGDLTKLPAEICNTVMTKAEELANGACTALSQAAVAKKSLTRTTLAMQRERKLAEGRIRSRFAHFMKLDSLTDFVSKLKAAVEKAKQDLLKVKDEAMVKAATIVATSVADVVKKAIVPVKETLSQAADKAVEVAKEGLTKLTSILAQIPTKVQEALTAICQSLPGGDSVQGTCTSGVAPVVKKATEELGKVCTAGVTAMTTEATKACTTASAKADELLTSADGTPSSSLDRRS